MNHNKTSETKPLSVSMTKSMAPKGCKSGIQVPNFNESMGGIRSGQGAYDVTQRTPGKADKRGY